MSGLRLLRAQAMLILQEIRKASEGMGFKRRKRNRCDEKREEYGVRTEMDVRRDIELCGYDRITSFINQVLIPSGIY